MKTLPLKNSRTPLRPRKGKNEKFKGTKLTPAAAEGQLPVDIFENETGFLIIAPLAGVNLEETDVVLTHDVLTIRGKRTLKPEEFGFKKSEGVSQECFWGPFSRSVILPREADPEKIEMRAHDQMLYVRIPRKQGIVMKILKIKT